MYSTHNEEKFVLAERFIKALTNKIYKYMTSISKNVYIDKLDDIVNINNNTYYKTIKMKPVDVKSSIYMSFNKGNYKEGLKFKVDDNVRISKYKNIFCKKNSLSNGTLQISLNKFLWLKNLKMLFRRHMLLVILTVKKLLEYCGKLTLQMINFTANSGTINNSMFSQTRFCISKRVYSWKSNKEKRQ